MSESFDNLHDVNPRKLAWNFKFIFYYYYVGLYKEYQDACVNTQTLGSKVERKNCSVSVVQHVQLHFP
ncbi:hypothetical protein AHAS_Ahas02G0157900 [Arachis hypogaea]